MAGAHVAGHRRLAGAVPDQQGGLRPLPGLCCTRSRVPAPAAVALDVGLLREHQLEHEVVFDVRHCSTQLFCHDHVSTRIAVVRTTVPSALRRPSAACSSGPAVWLSD